MSYLPTKVCTGPAHEQPTRLPLTAEHWYFHRSGVMEGKPLARCRLCVNWTKLIGKHGPHGWVPIGRVHAYGVELLDRCGSASRVEAVHGIHENTILAITRRSQPNVQRKTVARLLVALGEQRKLDRRNGVSKRFLDARKAQANHEARLSELSGY